MRAPVLLSAAFFLSAGAAAAEHFSTAGFESGTGRVALVELYTSEGCSSCPPADRWLSAQKSAAGLWTNFVPMALHVEYWNYIGWPDRFSDAAFSERQRALVDAGTARAVYTPGFFVDGAEWLGWRRGKTPEPRNDSPGNLVLRVDGRTVTAMFVPATDIREPLTVHVALLGMELETAVAAGENEGRVLEHDFVVLALEHGSMRESASVYRATLALPPIDSDAASYSIAAFVTASDGLVPIQAVGGPLD